MPQKTKKKSRKTIATAIATTLVAVGTWWTVKTNNISFRVPVYQAERVIDGDTFVTKEGIIIRLWGVDAPEQERCGADESKKELEKLILGKPLYIKVVYKDDNRLIADVYSLQGSVAIKMLSSGWAYSMSRGDAGIKEASDKARTAKLGIYSPKCTQAENPENPKCQIKGNQRYGDKTKYYRFPGCRQYSITTVQLFLGDQWFCSESEAQKAGYTKGTDCSEKTWTK